MKKLLSLLILAAMAATALVGCTAGTSSEQELYELGVDVVGTMKKLLKSDEYAEIYGVNDELRELAESVDLSDYDEPEAVYAVTLTDVSEFCDEFLADADVDWDDLSDVVKEQLEAKLGAPTLITQINSAMGTAALASSSMYLTVVEDEELRLDESATYIYVYESGAVVAVTFGRYGSAQGQLIFTDDPDDIGDVFEDCGWDVRELDVK